MRLGRWLGLALMATLGCEVFCASGLAQSETALLDKYRQPAIERWEKDIQALEALDKKESYSDQAILFTGSSSIRRWEDIASDMLPWEAIRRGYGGARFSDLAVFIDRIVKPHDCRAVVIFVGNDIAGSDQDKTPEEALSLYKYIVGRIHAIHPKVPIFCIAVTPTSSRFDVWPKVQEMNRLIREYSENQENLHFIATAKHYLGEDGKPIDELFVADRLHLNADGYKIWARIIKAELRKVLGAPK